MVGALTPTNVARVQIPVFKAIILCGLSLLLVQVPLLRKVFLRVLRFSTLLKTQNFQYISNLTSNQRMDN